MKTTTIQRLEERQDTPLILTLSAELLNAMSLQTCSNVNSPTENSMPLYYLGSGCNNHKVGSLSPKHNVFVLGVDGKSLTPTTNARARKMLKDRVAEPVWNKFSQFGIQMLVKVGTATPKTVLGIDNGTKFEGYAVVTGKENNLAVMWKLPNKKKLVKKLEERRRLRRARRQRNCRRRECRFDNRERKGFIAPSQLQIVNSRLKCISEMFKCYPIDTVAIEDVRFNHRDNKWGKNFSTVEVGKQYLYSWIQQKADIQLFTGYDTEDCRNTYGYKKSGNKNAEVFNAHCSDALAIATDAYAQMHIEAGTFLIADDTYRAVRRKLHDTQFSKGHIRYPYSTGNAKGIRKGTMSNFGQVCGDIKGKLLRCYNLDKKRLSKPYEKVEWLSHKFNTHEVNESQFTTATRLQCPLAT